jgi:hypothetical protein
VCCGAFLGDGRVLVGCKDGTAQFWDALLLWPGTPAQVRLGVEALTGLELDAHDRVRALGPDERLRRRVLPGPPDEVAPRR